VWHRDHPLIYQISHIATSSLKIFNNWYAKRNPIHVSISEILDFTFELVVFAARWLEYHNWNNLPSVNLWRRVNIRDADLLKYNVHTQCIRGSKNLGFGIMWLQIDLKADASFNMKLMASTTTNHKRHFMGCFCRTCLSLPADRHVEDAVSMLFGLCHRRCTTTLLLLIPRFNGRDTLSLSSVKVIRYLQLNFSPRVHIPDRPLGEPPAGHQLDRTYIEALEDCICGNFESELSADERTPCGSICDLQHLPDGFRSGSCYVVHLGTYLTCSTVESHVMLYHDP
jgi:hypothetical protein